MKTHFNLWYFILIAILFIACKKEDPKPIEQNDYRNKWCGNYEFTIYKYSWYFPGDVYYDTLYKTGKVYYTKDMQENEIFIQNDSCSNNSCSNIGIVKVDTNGILILSEIYRGSKEGKFTGNDNLFYRVSASPGQAYSYSKTIIGIKK